MKADIIRAVHNFEEEGRWPRGTNASFISLIPKVENPHCLNEFRPISLVGCMYKIVLNQVVFNVLKNPNPLKDVEASALLDAAVLV